MSQIHITDLTYRYEGSLDYVFEHVSFSIDTNWKIVVDHDIRFQEKIATRVVELGK